jgi:hypothetical protein
MELLANPLHVLYIIYCLAPFLLDSETDEINHNSLPSKHENLYEFLWLYFQENLIIFRLKSHRATAADRFRKALSSL